MSIKDAIKKIKDEIPKNCELVAVSKTKSVRVILEAYEVGQVHFGENKVQELLDKSEDLPLDIKWHFIGKLQSNKINQLLKVKNLSSIHSIDSIKLLDKLLSKKIDKIIELFIQVNTSLEEEKSGFHVNDDFLPLISKIESHEKFSFKGFMTIGKIRTENFEEDAKKSFALLQSLKQKYSINRQVELSMGMSNDYMLATQFETNWIRVGSRIFGDRS